MSHSFEHISYMVTQDKKPGSRGSDSEEGSLIVDDVRQEVLKQSQTIVFWDGFPRKTAVLLDFVQITLPPSPPFPPPTPCFGRRTISFLVKFESSVLCILVA